MNKSTLFQPRSSSGLLFGEADGAWVITTYLEKGPSAVPIALCCRQQSRRVFYTGAHHRALRHPRKARLTPQALIASRERSQRYSRRATSGGPARRSRGKSYIKGIFWYFLLLVTKSTTRDGPTSGIALTSTATTPCQGPCACGRRNVCAPHGPCQKLAEPIACQRLPA